MPVSVVAVLAFEADRIVGHVLRVDVCSCPLIGVLGAISVVDGDIGAGLAKAEAGTPWW